MKELKYIIGIVVLVTLNSCANRGRPSGGDYDTIPPVIIKSEPENFTNNFNSSEVNILFDEYIKIRNLQKELIISPPIDPIPEIIPVGSASKDLAIRGLDSLNPNTTYSFSFGESFHGVLLFVILLRCVVFVFSFLVIRVRPSSSSCFFLSLLLQV